MVNLIAFPDLGGLPNEVGSGNMIGGIGGPWPFNLPLQDYLQGYGSKKKSKNSQKKSKKSKKGSKKKGSKKNKKSSKK